MGECEFFRVESKEVEGAERRAFTGGRNPRQERGVSVSCSAREPKEIGEGGKTCPYGWRKLEQTRDAGELFRVREATAEKPSDELCVSL